MYSESDNASFASFTQRHNASLIVRTTDEQHDMGEVAMILSIRRNNFCTIFLRVESIDSSAGYILTNQSLVSANGLDGNGSVSFNSTQETIE